VSYPFLWDTPQHDKIQWNGAAENKGLGALGRNVGEVLGVFGDFEIPERPPQTGYASSVRIRNLLALEDSVKTLWSPQWPDAFPPIDPAKRDRGKQVYVDAGCIECHAILDRTDPARRIEAIMRAVGTDPRMAENFDNRAGSSGKLEGAYVRVIRWPPLNPERIGPVAPADQILSHTVVGTILGAWKEAPEDELSQVQYRRRPLERAVTPQALGGGIYKARPLNGIWATAPYLHNGSVANLRQLLLPAKDRLPSFSIGTRQFDPVHVGFRTDAPGFPRFTARDEHGRPIPANSNAGHEYGAQLSNDDRWALVEYLKSL
jgi:mono/diheme cytochrome c family protein